MKLVFVSDIHGSAYYARMLPEIDKRETPERIVLLGDLLYHGPRNDLPRDYAPKEVISILNSRWCWNSPSWRTVWRCGWMAAWRSLPMATCSTLVSCPI